MKKTVAVVGIVVAAIALLAGVTMLSYIGGEEITEGTYKIRNYPDYPEAYIEVKGNEIQFHNIDLNAIYRDDQVADYHKMVEMNSDFAVAEEEFDIVSDLNWLLVDNPYKLEYDGDAMQGTFEYVYFCTYKGTPFGVVIIYDSFHKTLMINNYTQKILFEK